MTATPVEIAVLGPGCANCVRLESHVAQALESTGIAGTITKVTDYAEIARWGVMATPGLVIDGTVVIAGRVPSVDEVKELLADATASAQ